MRPSVAGVARTFSVSALTLYLTVAASVVGSSAGLSLSVGTGSVISVETAGAVVSGTFSFPG